MALRFVPYHHLGDTPNVVVDGSPTASTRLTLSHWPGSPTPPELLDDLSAQIAFHALDTLGALDGIGAVSNNHFDQDGLASVHVLVAPDEALARRARIIDVASAGDFATFTDRDSMRIAMAIAAHDDPARSPLGPDTFRGGYEDQCAALYEAMIPRFAELLDHPERFRDLWADEDAHLTESLDAIDAGVVRLEEVPELDLAVCVVPDDWAARTASRFTMSASAALHPAAVPNRTTCMRVLTSHGGHHRLECRYETWVMYRSRPVTPRPDLRPLAALLAHDDPEAGWAADAPGGLTPALWSASPSALPLDRVLTVTRAYLHAAPPAWDPITAS